MNHLDELAPSWPQLNRLLDEALSLPPPERDGWLQALPAEHAGLKDTLAKLLEVRAGIETGDFLGTLPKLDGAERAVSDAPDIAAPQAGQEVGPWRLIRELGEGGMGSVWLAERADGQLKRQVALKLPRLTWARGLAERMARERDILATLEHTHIARLYDAGVDKLGRPWMALEYVQGRPIDTYAKDKALTLRQRVELLLQVCEAVAYAHSRVVIHRDLKPSNILVTDDGQVRLLDFGIAKLMQGDSAQVTALTELSGRALTLAYASPEQIVGEPLTTTSDVYSLGVLLFELLAEVRPYGLASRSRAALEEAISQGALPRPSALAPAERRPALRGDLDTIVLKALQREPARRYPTADALADDLLRHLEERPVLAQPDRAWYRALKFVRRNRLPVAVSTALLAALLVGLAGTVWQAHVAREEQQRAEAVKSFVAGLFTDADPFSTASKTPTVEALLQSAQVRLDRAAGGGPEVRVELLNMIGKSFSGLGLFDRAEPVFAQAIAEARRDLGDDHALTRGARLSMLEVHRFRGRRAEVKAELDSLLPVLREARTPVQREQLLAALTASVHLGIDEGRYAAARDVAQEVVALATAQYGEVHPITAEAVLLQASIGAFLGDADKTLALATQARDLLMRVHGTERAPARVLDGRFLYGRALGNVGRYREARAELEDVLARVQRLLGAQASMAAFVAHDVSRFALELGDEAAALEHAKLTMAIAQRDAEEGSYTVAAARLQFGRALLALHRGEEARVELERAQRAITAARGANAQIAIEAVALHAAALAQVGRLGEAWQLLEPRLPAYRTAPVLARYRGLHTAGIVKRLRGDLAAAMALQEEAMAALPDHALQVPRRNAVLGEQALVALEHGDAAAALRWLERVALPEGSAGRSLEEAARQLTRGRALLVMGRPDAALAVLQAAEADWQALAPQAAASRAATRWREQAAKAAMAR